MQKSTVNEPSCVRPVWVLPDHKPRKQGFSWRGSNVVWIKVEPGHDKMRTTKVQISLRIRTFWSAPLLSAANQNDTSSLYIRNFKILAGLYSWASQFVSCLVGDSRRHIFLWYGSVWFLHTRPGFLCTRPTLGNVVLHEGCKTSLVHDLSMTVSMFCCHVWHLDVIFMSVSTKRFDVNI